ncbi:MAG: hypothetical protein ACUVSF_02685 [Anaerolineae bacterium]
MIAYRSDAHPANGRPESLAGRDFALAISLSLCLFSLYLLSYRGGFHSVDEVSMFAVTESLVKFGAPHTDQIAWTQWTTTQREAQGFFGIDGHVYSKKAPLFSLVMAPLYGLALLTPGIGMLQTASLTNALVTAGTAGLVYMSVRALAFNRFVALATAGIFGTATIAWVYSKYLFSEPLSGLLLLGVTFVVLRVRGSEERWSAGLAGFLAGLAVATRVNNLFVVPVWALYLVGVGVRCDPSVGQCFRRGAVRLLYRLLPLLCFLGGVLPPLLLLLLYNALRSGNPLQTGYDLTIFSPEILTGLYKLLLSPLRGLFVYSPVLLLSLPGMIWLWRRHRGAVLLVAGVSGITLLLFATWSSGEGLSWGSRFLVPLVPLLSICLAPLVERTYRHNLVATALLGVLGCVSLVIQVLGVAINPWVYLSELQAKFGGEFFLEHTAALTDFRYAQPLGQLRMWSLENSDVAWWQLWGLDLPALGLSFLLLVITSAHMMNAWLGRWLRGSWTIAGVATLVISVALLGRYYVTDQQFGKTQTPPYLMALERGAMQARPHESIVTVAPYHYHLPMNRFKALVPLIGFARQTAPLTETAMPLLEHAVAGRNVWLVTVGCPPAAADNPVEWWLAHNVFKASDEWIEDARLIRYATSTPPLTIMVRATIGDMFRLETVRVPVSVTAGDAMPIEMHWRAIASSDADYNIFAQLLAKDGLPIAQHDGPPVGGYAPTHTWRVGEEIRDRRALILPPTVAAGSYRLIVGMVNPANGQRLRLADSNEDVIVLANITVEATSP